MPKLSLNCLRDRRRGPSANTNVTCLYTYSSSSCEGKKNTGLKRRFGIVQDIALRDLVLFTFAAAVVPFFFFFFFISDSFSFPFSFSFLSRFISFVAGQRPCTTRQPFGIYDGVSSSDNSDVADIYLRGKVPILSSLLHHTADEDIVGEDCRRIDVIFY